MEEQTKASNKVTNIEQKNLKKLKQNNKENKMDQKSIYTI